MNPSKHEPILSLHQFVAAPLTIRAGKLLYSLVPTHRADKLTIKSSLLGYIRLVSQTVVIIAVQLANSSRSHIYPCWLAREE
jgi:hypothetical protein